MFRQGDRIDLPLAGTAANFAYAHLLDDLTFEAQARVLLTEPGKKLALVEADNGSAMLYADLNRDGTMDFAVQIDSITLHSSQLPGFWQQII